MAKVRFDSVAESSSTSGTGNITLAGALNKSVTFTAAGVAVSDTFKYRIEHVTNNEWEVGTGTMLTSTTFSRSVLRSSNANALVNFSTGGLTVELVVDAADLNAMEAVASDTAAGDVELATTAEVLTGTDTARAVTPDALAALWEKGADNAGGATITLGDGYQFDLITSTTTITALAFTTDKAGRMALLRFATARQVTHNATSLISPTNGNLQMGAGDLMLVESLGGGNFRIITVWRNDVVQNLPGVVAIVTNGAATAATTNLSGGSFTIPANTLRVGSVYRLSLHYVHNHQAAPPTLTCEVLINGVVVESLVITFTAAIGTQAGWVEALVVCRTTGASGTVMVTMTQATNGGSNIANQIMATTGTATDTIDTTQARSLEMRIRMTTGVASTTLTLVQGMIEKVN